MRRTRKKITSPFTQEKQKQINVNRRVVGWGGIKQLQLMKTQWRMVTSLRSHTEAPPLIPQHGPTWAKLHMRMRVFRHLM